MVSDVAGERPAGRGRNTATERQSEGTPPTRLSPEPSQAGPRGVPNEELFGNAS